MNGSLAFTVFALCLPFQEPSQEPSLEAPAAALAPESTEKPAPKYKRPRRGPAPTLNDLSSVEYETNSDGTIRRRVVTIGGVVNEGLSDPEPKPLVDLDPNYRPPERSTIGSINEPRGEQATSAASTTKTNPAPGRSISGPLLLIAIFGALVATGFLIGFLSKPASLGGATDESPMDRKQ